MLMLSKVRALIAEHEGLRLLPYKDTVGKLTIGYGHNLEDNPIPVEVADMLLDGDIKDAILDSQNFEWFEGLDAVRQAVIVSMVFNMGFKGFSGFKKTIGFMEKRSYLNAGAEMLDSKWARQVPTRAVALSKMMKTGNW